MALVLVITASHLATFLKIHLDVLTITALVTCNTQCVARVVGDGQYGTGVRSNHISFSNFFITYPESQQDLEKSLHLQMLLGLSVFSANTIDSFSGRNESELKNSSYVITSQLTRAYWKLQMRAALKNYAALVFAPLVFHNFFEAALVCDFQNALVGYAVISHFSQ